MKHSLLNTSTKHIIMISHSGNYALMFECLLVFEIILNSFVQIFKSRGKMVQSGGLGADNCRLDLVVCMTS